MNIRGKEQGNIDDTLVHFLHYVDHSTWEYAKGDQKIEELDEMVEHMKADDRMEESYMNMQWLEEMAMEMGREKGMEEGRKKGLEEGREEGRYESLRYVAVNLLDVLTDDQIAAKTGLSLEEINRLRKENQKKL